MKRLLRLLLISLFALLQCAAPLVHAHIDGQQGDSLLPSGFEVPTSVLSQAQAPSLEEHESAAVSLPDELLRNASLSICGAPQSVLHPVAPPAASALPATLTYPEPSLPRQRYHSPHRQAPPRV